jgi:hypothetical protein
MRLGVLLCKKITEKDMLPKRTSKILVNQHYSRGSNRKNYDKYIGILCILQENGGER